MSQLGMRPRFKLHLEHVDVKTSYDKIKENIQTETSDCTGMFRESHMEILFKPELRKSWSPRLSLDFEQQGEGTSIRGLIAPQPSVWTLFMACYFTFGMIAFVGVTLAYSQWSLGEYPWGLYMLLGAFVGDVLVYMLSLVGQRLAFEQTVYLRTLLLESLGLYREKMKVH